MAWTFHSPVRLALLLTIGFICSACSGVGGTLTLQSEKGSFSQKFDQAYVGRSEDGDLHLILINEGVQANRSARKNAEVKPAADTPLRQVVHLRVLWRAYVRAGNDDSVVTNASANWFVTGVGALGHSDLLHYAGAGTVTHSRGGDVIKATLRDFTMRPKQVRGELADPIGTSIMNGKVRARWDNQFVRNMLTEFDDVAAGANGR